jgi:hypothetical protein
MLLQIASLLFFLLVIFFFHCVPQPPAAHFCGLSLVEEVVVVAVLVR